MIRIAWLAAGWIFFAIGVAGVVLPGLPSTAPMLLAVACFARGSERLHQWLLNHRVFGPSLRRWQEHRTIALRAKITALTMMVGSIAYLAFVAALPLWGRWVAIGLVVVGMVVVIRIPHTSPATSEETS